MKHEKLKEFLNPDAMKRLCRDYVLEHETLTLLSWDDVIENGKEWDDDIDYDSCGYRICDVSGEEEVPYTGLLYELFPDGSLKDRRLRKSARKNANALCSGQHYS